MAMAIFATFMIFLLCSPSMAILLTRLQLPSPLTGPESLAFDRNGGGPYVGVSDGRILKYSGPNEGFKEYAYSSPNRNKTICDGLADFSELQSTCGRPLGLRFNHQTGDLYVADAYFGLVKIGPNGGPPTQYFTGTQQQPSQENDNTTTTTFQFLDGLDVDVNTGIVYFTQASANFRFKDAKALQSSRDASGSLFSLDPTTNQTRVLMNGLALASGVAVSRDGSFVLVTEYLAYRIQRYWLKGPRANSSDLFMQLTARPDNIIRNPRGQFWVAVNGVLGPILPPPTPPPRPTILPGGLRISENGILLQIKPMIQEFGNEAVSEVHEFNNTLYSGSLIAPYAAISTMI